ncbi:MAG: LLM class flavin-dependent oxidoreductase [Nitrososphaerota archaeon]
MRVDLGFSLPVGQLRVGELVHAARMAESAGISSIWLHENPAYGDSLIACHAILSSTTSIKVCTGAVSVVTRHPVMLAASAATLQNESNGRFVLGVSLGGFPWLPLIGYSIHPLSESKPLVRIFEAISIIRDLHENGITNRKGRFYNVNGFRIAVKPYVKVPIYVASMGPRILRKAPMIADGVITSPGVMTVKSVEELLKAVKSGEAMRNRAIDKAAYVLSSVAKDRAEAYKSVKRDPFFIYQLSEVVSEESLLECGVGVERLPDIRNAWRNRDLLRASELITDEMVHHLTATGKPEDVMNRLEEYWSTGHDRLIAAAVGDWRSLIDVIGTLNQ